MDYLPVSLKKSRPFLQTISERGSRCRSICPKRELVAFVDQHGCIRIHLLSADDRQAAIESQRFLEFLWVSPCLTNKESTLDRRDKEKRWLLAVTSSLDLAWYAVGNKAEEGRPLCLERVSEMTRVDFSYALRKMECIDTISSLKLLGSHNGEVLVCVNEGMVCRLGLDNEFHCIRVQSSLLLETSLQDLEDQALPEHLEGPLDFCFRNPLLLFLYRGGFVMSLTCVPVIYNVEMLLCVGVLSINQYCAFVAGGQQSDSESLMHEVRSSQFLHLAVSTDLSKLVVGTLLGHLVLVNLSEYFTEFQVHYTPPFLKSHRDREVASAPSSAGKAWLVRPVTLAMEEMEEKLRYTGSTQMDSTCPCVCTPCHPLYLGYRCWTQRLASLERNLNTFQPSKGGYLNLSHSYELGTGGGEGGGGGRGTVYPGPTLSHCWYEHPAASQANKCDGSSMAGFDLPFCPGFKKPSVGAGEVDQAVGVDPALEGVRTRRYLSRCLLPSATPQMDVECRVSHIEVTPSMVVVYYGVVDGKRVGSRVGEGEPLVGLAEYKIDMQTYSVARLSHPSWLVTPCNPEQPLCFANDVSLSLVTFFLSQEEFVDKVLTYSSARVAEDLCQLNRWDRCSLPINALVTALDLRQLDTISFFLRNRDSGTQEDSKETEGGAEVLLMPPIPAGQVGEAVDLLMKAVEKDHHEKQYNQFATQLIAMTLNFLTRMIKSQVRILDEQQETSVTSSLKRPTSSSHMELSHDALTSIAANIHKLRSFLPSADRFDLTADLEGTKTAAAGRCFGIENLVDPGNVAKWEKQAPKDIIQDALLQGCLPQAQTFLIHRSSMSSLSADRDGLFVGSFPSVLSLGVGFVIKALEGKYIPLASSLLAQMGFDVCTSLKYICFNTISRPLRDFLAEDLVRSGWMNESELQALEYVHTLETHYPMCKFERAKAVYTRLHAKKPPPTYVSMPVAEGGISKVTIPKQGNLDELYPETFGGDYTLTWHTGPLGLTEETASQQPSCLYIQVPLSIVLKWDIPTRQKLLMEAFVLSKPGSSSTELSETVSSEVMFEYYISHHNVEGAMQFVIPPTKGGDLALCHPEEAVAMCSKMAATRYMQDSLLDQLARNGVFLPSELSELPQLLYRLGRAHNLMTTPHPLSKVSAKVTGNSIVSLSSFHQSFVNYLIKSSCVGLLYQYLDAYQLALDLPSIVELGLDKANEPWVDLMLKYRMAALKPADPESIFLASLSCSRLLLQTPAISISDMLLMPGRALMALATLMYAPVPIEETTDPSNRRKDYYVDRNVLERALEPYPTLKAAISPPPESTTSPAQTQDITVYQLLEGSVPFSVHKLFQWQNTNRQESSKKEDIRDTTAPPLEIPHFSSASLVEKYSPAEHLPYTYYLQRGQPSFALANLVATKLHKTSGMMKKINKVVSSVYCLALQSFTDAKVTASCAALLEMLDRDSTLLRVDVQAACRIFKHRHIEANLRLSETEKRNRIANQFTQMYQSSESSNLSSGLLTRLEIATTNMIKQAGVNKCSLDSEQNWCLVQDFCRCHKLPPSSAFLLSCAEAGEWLPLLCHAQLYSIPAQKVLSIIEKNFSDPNIREHLRLAISSIGQLQQDQQPGPSSSGTTGSTQRSLVLKKDRVVRISSHVPTIIRPRPDPRAKFYLKMGLQKGASSELAAPVPTTQPAATSGRATPPDTPLGGPPPLDSIAGPLDTSILISADTELEELPSPVGQIDLPEDLFSVLFKCEDLYCEQQWRALLAYAIALQNPLLAIFAACYKGSSMIHCMCVWLYCTLGFEVLDKATAILDVKDDDRSLQFSAKLQWREWSLNDIAIILVVAMQHNPSPAAQFTLAFQYFDEGNPLAAFIKFYEAFILRFDIDECKQHLRDFESSLQKSPNSGFAESLSVVMVQHMLVICPSSFERIHLLELLANSSYGERGNFNAPNYKELYKISCLLQSADVPLDVAFSIRPHFSPTPEATSPALVYAVRVRVESEQVLALLLNKGKFVVAREFASLVGLTSGEITLREAEHNLNEVLKSSYWHYEQARLNFWHLWNKRFQHEKVEPHLAAEFFESAIHLPIEEESTAGLLPSPSTTTTEHTVLLALALKWKQVKNTLSAEELKEFERKIWLCHIRATVEAEAKIDKRTSASPLPFLEEDNSSVPIVETPLLSTLSLTGGPQVDRPCALSELILLENIPVALDHEGRSCLSEKEATAFNLLLGKLLNLGLVTRARELAALFGHNSPDLTIVLCCIQLAQGKLTLDKLTDDVLNLLHSNRPTGLHQGSGVSFAALDQDREQKPSADVVKMIQKLSERARYAQRCCNCVLVCFRIALILKKSYKEVVYTDPFELLTLLLSSAKCTEKYFIAKQLVSSVNLETKNVAEYLADCVRASLRSHFEGVETDMSKSSTEDLKPNIYSADMDSSRFMELATLCSDHSLLGYQLLSMAKEPLRDLGAQSSLNVPVELLIRSHDCFGYGCCVDGISEVLIVAKQWTDILLSKENFKLMVRLLTGIGRFNELSYIVGHILKHDQFELLVQRGVDKEAQLKGSLMAYLRKHCRNDTEKMQMVALKFGMFRELARSNEEFAMKNVKKLKGKPLVSTNVEIKKTLESVYDELRVAGKTYSQENYVSSAERCYSQARLVALQLSLLKESSSKEVINLEPKAVSKFVEEQPFIEALVVADAYKDKVHIDWVNTLYKKVIITGDFRYFHEFKMAFSVSSTLFQDLASRFQHDKDKTVETANNMRKLLAVHLKNLPLKHKLATELGLSDVLQSMSSYDSGYLSDLAKLGT